MLDLDHEREACLKRRQRGRIHGVVSASAVDACAVDGMPPAGRVRVQRARSAGIIEQGAPFGMLDDLCAVWQLDVRFIQLVVI